MASTIRSGMMTCSTDLVMGSYTRVALKSGNTRSRLRACPSGSSSSGVESEKAVAMPAKAFSAPGPYCMANTDGERPLLTRAKPSAMPTPTRSWRQMIGRISASAAASIRAVVG